jgi:indole-3-glycerol phosphate synthase
MILDDIVATKQDHVRRLQKAFSRSRLEDLIKARPPRRSLKKALDLGAGPRVIAEIKRAAPSRGPIDLEADAAQVARAYQAGGAAAISVLTDEPFFKGRAEDLLEARQAVELPVLCKDFLVTDFQVRYAAAMGADAILLITAILDRKRLQDLLALAHDLRLEALVEVHDRDELETALAIGPSLLGINNRNLKTMQVDLETTRSLAAEAGPGVTVVSESGISSRPDLDRLMAAGVRAFLVGTSLMLAKDRTLALKALLGEAS